MPMAVDARMAPARGSPGIVRRLGSRRSEHHAERRLRVVLMSRIDLNLTAAILMAAIVAAISEMLLRTDTTR
jgi:hypothetical protein